MIPKLRECPVSQKWPNYPVPWPSFVCLETKVAKVGMVIEEPKGIKIINAKRISGSVAKGIKNSLHKSC